jgi:hypothetical protein
VNKYIESSLRYIWVIILILTEPQLARGDIEGFRITKTVPAAGATVSVDFKAPGEQAPTVLTLPLDPGATPEAAAKDLADHINELPEPRPTATTSGSQVLFSTGFTLSREPGTTPGILTLVYSFVVAPPPTSLTTLMLAFAPDPATGTRVLTDAGDFAIQGPGGLNASFVAPAGTSATQLAGLFAQEMGSGYSPLVEGSSLLFTPPEAGDMSLQLDGNGISYELSAVPEPSTLLLVSIGAACLLAHRSVTRRYARR